MKLGVGSYTFVWWTGVPGYPLPSSPLTPTHLLDVAASLGAEVVQIADNMPLHALPRSALTALRAQASHLGIDLEIGTRGIDPVHLQQYLGIARDLGVRLVRTLLDRPDHEPAPDEAIALLRESARAFEDAGVTLAVENHDRIRAATLRHILQHADSPAIGVCLDTANSLGCGEGINEVLDALGDRVVNLHIKDFTAKRLPHNKGFTVEGVPAGKGLLDIPALLGKLRQAAHRISAIVELWPPPEEDIEAAVAKEKRWAEESVEYVRKLIRGEAMSEIRDGASHS